MPLPSWINKRDLADAMALLQDADETEAKALFDGMKGGAATVTGATMFAVVAQMASCMLDATVPGTARMLMRQLTAAAVAYHEMHREGYGRDATH